jgi:hypothetical protein
VQGSKAEARERERERGRRVVVERSSFEKRSEREN